MTSTISLGHLHAEMLQEAFWDGLIAGREGQIAFLLDDRGRVIRHTREVDSRLGHDGGLEVLDNRLTCIHPCEQAALDRAIACAVSREEPGSSALMVSRSSGKVALVVAVFPLHHISHPTALVEASALVNVIDPGLHPAGREHLYRQAFGLTPREGELAMLLLEGHSVESAAANLNMAMPTARTHMRRLFEKTSTTGQVPLVELLMRLVF